MRVRFHTSSSSVICDLLIKFTRDELKMANILIELNAMYRDTPEQFQELRRHGNSILADALCSSFEMINDKQKALEKMWQIFKLLFSVVMDPATRKFLLLKSNRNGSTPLYQLIQAIKLEDVQDYSEAMFRAIADNLITREEYKDTLLEFNQYGFTILHVALMGANPIAVQLCLEIAIQALRMGLITKQEYICFVTKRNKDGLTPLDIVLLEGTPENIKAYFDGINQALREKHMTNADYVGLLRQRNQNGLTSMHLVLRQGVLVNVIAYLDCLRQARKEWWISNYGDLLTESDLNGSNPLHHAFMRGNSDNAEAYLKSVRMAFDDKRISIRCYIKFLLKFNFFRATPLHIAMSQGNPKSVRIYLNAINAVLHEKQITCDEYSDLLNQFDNAMLTALNQAVRKGNIDAVSEFVNLIRAGMPAEESEKVLMTLLKRVSVCSREYPNARKMNKAIGALLKDPIKLQFICDAEEAKYQRTDVHYPDNINSFWQTSGEQLSAAALPAEQQCVLTKIPILPQ